MKANLVGKPEAKLYHLGFSNEAGILHFHFDADHPSMARVVAHDAGMTTNLVAVDTVDGFCAVNDIQTIDFTKIDVEGHEIPVLEGAGKMLSDGRIAILRIETAIDPDIAYHTQLWDLCEALHPHGYRLFGLYDQAEFPPEPDNAKLRRFDVAFISPEAQRRSLSS